MKNKLCPCKSGEIYSNCCEPFHQERLLPVNPEQLMRSRYTGFILRLGDYLFSTYHKDFRGSLTSKELSEETLDWVDLEIVKSTNLDKSLEKTLGENSAIVEFKAWYLDNKELNCHHESSNFIKENGKWFYTDGIFHSQNRPIKVKRNDPCPCGSSKKFKKCCGSDS